MAHVESVLDNERGLAHNMAQGAVVSGLKTSEMLLNSSARLEEGHPHLARVAERLAWGSLMAGMLIAANTPSSAKEAKEMLIDDNRDRARGVVFLGRLSGRLAISTAQQLYSERRDSLR